MSWIREIRAFGILAGLLAASAAQASVTNITVLPSYPGAAGISGNLTSGAPGFESQSWYETGPGKAEVYFDATALFGHNVTIAQLQSISYWTNTPTPISQNQGDWTLYIYTQHASSDNSATWYQSRLNAEPYFTKNPGFQSGTWVQWSTNDPNYPLRFYDANRNGGGFGTYTDPTLASIQSGPVTWQNNSTHNYSGESILYISLQTGSNWANGFTGLVDGLSITLNNVNHDQVNINLEATPEPATLAIWGGLGLAGIVSARRRKRNVPLQA